jgi:hypothetical protein
MSKYRCPICGAVHKQFQPNCRLCGQSLSADNIPTTAPAAAAPTGSKSGIKGVFFLGAAIVLVILVGAVAFGVVQSNRAIEEAKELVLQQNTDGWSPLVCVVEGASTETTPTCTVPAGQGFSVELPGDRTKSNTAFTAAAGQKMETWSTTISDDTQLEVIFGKVNDPQTGAPVDPTDKLALQRIADEWMAAKGLTREIESTGSSEVKVDETSFGGYPTLVVTTPSSDVTINNQPAYLQTMFVLRDDVLFVVQTTSIYENAEQFSRMIDSLAFT